MGRLEDISPQSRLARLSKVVLVLTLLCGVGVSNGSVVVAQTGEKNLLDRITGRASASEPEFKLVFKRKPTGEDVSYNLGWKFKDDFVSVTFYEVTSTEAAATRLQLTINAPVSVITATVKLDGLADEAYIKEHGAYSKPGSTSVFFRKRKFVVTLSASSPELAKRFAKHIVAEIDAQ